MLASWNGLPFTITIFQLDISCPQVTEASSFECRANIVSIGVSPESLISASAIGLNNSSSSLSVDWID